ncbi:hypothetical protein [Labilibacter marinus]|uniref:hypothetical protein n=1 Tax=Labilibacter marinus TaxID=1477105 RepID=UPI00117A1F9B|nr:hypothetical protein [Labilibacter marinus]
MKQFSLVDKPNFANEKLMMIEIKFKTIVVFVFLILTQSCAVFKGRQELDMQPFSDNTNVLFNEAMKISRPFQFKSLSTYTDITAYTSIKQKSLPLIHALKGIVYYSNQLVAISNSSMSENGKNDQLAKYLSDAFERVKHKERMDSIGLSYSQVEFSLGEIRKAETYREGIEASDPIINTIVLSLSDRLDEIEALIGEVIVSFDANIYNDTKATIDNYITLKKLQNSTQKKITQLYYAQSIDASYIDSLIISDHSIVPYLKKERSLEQADYDTAEELLFKRLANIDTMLRQLDDDKKEYMDMKEEISRWHSQVDEKISIARNAIIVWSQSHKNLGKGIEVPPLIGIDSFLELVKPTLNKAVDTVVL